MLDIMGMNRIIKLIFRWSAIALALLLVFVLSIYITMSVLIKGKEIATPNWVGKSVQAAYSECKRLSIQVQPIEGSRLTEGVPFIITRQFPEPGVKIKRYGIVKIYYTPRPDKILMPEICGKSLDESLKIMSDSGIRKGSISYIDSSSHPVDFVISQSIKTGEMINRGETVSLLVSRGERPFSYIMPDFIGLPLSRVEQFLKDHNLKIAKIEPIPYPVESGIVVKQYPHSGFRINEKNLITLGVSQ